MNTNDFEANKQYFDVWSEGFILLGKPFIKTVFWGRHLAKDFPEACEIALSKSGIRDGFNKNDLTWYGCRMFPTREEASKVIRLFRNSKIR